MKVNWSHGWKVELLHWTENISFLNSFDRNKTLQEPYAILSLIDVPTLYIILKTKAILNHCGEFATIKYKGATTYNNIGNGGPMHEECIPIQKGETKRDT